MYLLYVISIKYLQYTINCKVKRLCHIDYIFRIAYVMYYIFTYLKDFVIHDEDKFDFFLTFEKCLRSHKMMGRHAVLDL